MVQSQAVMTREDNHDNPLFPAEGLAQSLPCERFRLSLKIKSLNILLLDGMNRNGIVTIKNHLSNYPDKWHAIRKGKNDNIAKESIDRLYMISD